MARKPLTVWITRAEPAASETAERVAAHGHKPIVQPLLTLERLPHPQLDLHDVRAHCLSKAVARPLAKIELAEVVSCPIPVEAALLNLLDRKA
jgi:hypothetical protein